MRHGGIFNALSALGTAGVGEWAPPEMPCTVSSCANSVNDIPSYEFAKYLQETLRNNGFPGLVADGLWGACTKNAFEKATGTTFSKASIESYLPVKCTKVSQYSSGCNYKKTCDDGSDRYVAPATPDYTQPVPDKFVPEPSTGTPINCEGNCFTQYSPITNPAGLAQCIATCRGIQIVKPTTPKLRLPGVNTATPTTPKLRLPGVSTTTPAVPKPFTPRPKGQAKIEVVGQRSGIVKAGLIPGLTNKQLMIGLVALAAVGAIVVATKKKKAGKE